MDITSDAAASGGEVPVAVHQAGGEGSLSVRAAANSVRDWRHRNKPRHKLYGERSGAQQRVARHNAVPQGSVPSAAHERAPEHDTHSFDAQASRDAAPSERTTSGVEPTAIEPEGELPPIEPPRFWTKDARDRWATLPRETQAYIATREQERDREVRRSQNEAAELRKAFQADQATVTQARQSYEQALPMLMRNLHAAMAGDFADIRTTADVATMARTDPPRFARWNAQRQQLAGVLHEVGSAQQRRTAQRAHALHSYMTREGEKLSEHVPEAADPEQWARLQTAAVDVLHDLDFGEAELGELWRGQRALSLHDHRFQRLLRDAVKWREAQQMARDVTARAVPPVQRPGVAQPRSAATDIRIQNLGRKLDSARGLDALRTAAKIVSERRRAAR